MNNRLLEITTPLTPHYWALLERELFESQSEGYEESFARYFDERGYLLCVPHWDGDDGLAATAEDLLNWTILPMP